MCVWERATGIISLCVIFLSKDIPSPQGDCTQWCHCWRDWRFFQYFLFTAPLIHSSSLPLFASVSSTSHPFLSFMWGNIISHSANSQTHMNEQEGILKLGPHWGSKGEAGKSRHYAADSVKWRGVEGKVFSQSVMRIKPLKQNLKPSSAAQHRTCCPLQQCTAIWRRRPLYRFIN